MTVVVVAALVLVSYRMAGRCNCARIWKALFSPFRRSDGTG